MSQKATIPRSRLSALGDSICLRDPRGRTRRPSLVPYELLGRSHHEIRGPFAILQRFSITPEEGKSFVEASRDENPIHTLDSVVSGAMSAARVLLLPEILVPGLVVKSVRIKFRAFARYDRPSTNRYAFHPLEDGGFRVDLVLLQQGVVVAEGFLSATLRRPRPERGFACPPAELDGELPGELPGKLSARFSTEPIRAFFQSLRVDPDRGFQAIGMGYPRAYLASLPSGEMVRKGGTGGLLNVLDLEFPDVEIPEITLEPPPSVEVEPTRPRSAFRKVLARVGNGIVTYCQGYATVLASMIRGTPRESAMMSATP